MSFRIRGLGRLRAFALGCRKRRLGLVEVEPNYAFLEQFAPGDVVIDVGVGDDPDFSNHMMSRYDLTCYAVDPTRKHAEVLNALASSEPRFHYLPYCLGDREGTVTFHESKVNVSGSVMTQHRNVANDPVESYDVQMHTLSYLVEEVLRDSGASSIAIAKIDIEGAEYDLVAGIDAESLKPIRQMIIEFHHHSVSPYTIQDTRKAIRHIEALGMRSIMYNGGDCFFYRP